MNEPIITWSFFVCLIVWRSLSFQSPVQRFVHNNCYGWPFQWYVVTILVLAVFLAHTFVRDIFFYDFVHDHMLNSTRMRDDLRIRLQHEPYLNSTDLAIELDQCFIPSWMGWIAVSAPVVGVVSFLLLAHHIFTYMLGCNQIRRLELKNECVPVHDAKFGMTGARVRNAADARTGTIVDVRICQGPELTLGDGVLPPFKVHFDGEADAMWVPGPVHMLPELLNKWQVSGKEDLGLLVISMPAFFIVMSMRAEIRVLQIMTGSWEQDMSWEAAKATYTSVYTTDLELAQAYQYLSVWAFAYLCVHYFNLGRLAREVEEHIRDMKARFRAPEHRTRPDGSNVDDVLVELKRNTEAHRWSLVWGGMQGIWAFVFIGSLRSLFNIIMAVLKMENAKGSLQTVIEFQKDVLDQIAPVFIFSAVLCIYNTGVIFTMKDITDESAMGSDAALRFFATRGLLIISQVQPAVIRYIAKWEHISQFQGMLLNSSLLMVWCLFVVLFNRYSFAERRDKGCANEADEKAYLPTSCVGSMRSLKSMLSGPSEPDERPVQVAAGEYRQLVS